MTIREAQEQRYRNVLGIDANEIATGLWQGSAPPPGPYVRMAGFDALVLAAKEYQPSEDQFPGVAVLRLPIEDDDLSWDDWIRAVHVATLASNVRARGGRVLVTCQMGLNRSGLVSALSLLILDDMSGPRAVARVRSRRGGALFNESFANAVKRAR